MAVIASDADKTGHIGIATRCLSPTLWSLVTSILLDVVDKFASFLTLFNSTCLTVT